MDPRRAADERKERVRLRYPLCGLCGHHYDRRLAQTPVFGSLRSRRHLYPAMSDAEIEKHLCASRGSPLWPGTGPRETVDETVSGTLSPSRGLGAATWAAARPYREPRRCPVRVQPFPLRLSPGLFSGERRAADRKPGGLRYGLGNCT
jgi:hypothetical protein